MSEGRFLRLLANEFKLEVPNVRAIYRRSKREAIIRHLSKSDDRALERDQNELGRAWGKVEAETARLLASGEVADKVDAMSEAVRQGRERGWFAAISESLNIGATYKTRRNLISNWVHEGLNLELHLPPMFVRFAGPDAKGRKRRAKSKSRQKSR
jgi:hypothetical protein